jgi:KDO2-lipid IV(A) lauroyltransferase
MVAPFVNDRGETDVVPVAEAFPRVAPQSVVGMLAVSAVRIVGMLPFNIRSRIGYMLGYLVGMFPSQERSVAQLQIRYFLPQEPTKTIVRRTFGNAGRTALESLNLRPLLTPPYSAIRCDNWDMAFKCMTGPRPVIVLTGHTGNWDLLAAYAIARGARVATIGREARSPALQDVLRTIREGYGVETIWRSDKSGIKKLLNYLKDGRVVAALIDQDTRVDSAHVPFFSESAKTPSSLIALGKRCNAVFISSFLFRTSSRDFQVFAEVFDDNLSTDEILRQYSQRLESLIRRFPEQWVWFHKRWRTTPDGHTKSSREYLSWLQQKIFHATQSVALLIFCVAISACSLGSNDLQHAERLAKEGNYDEAIETYRAHMQSRLEVGDRPEWENPYFYLILIGDVQLKRGDPTAALAMYQEADAKLLVCEDPESKTFHETLLSDRYRALATWYAEHGQLNKALEILRQFRSRDSLIFDAMLDRVARKLSEQEQTTPKNNNAD